MNDCGKLLGVSTQQVIDTIKEVLESEKHYERLRAFAPNEKQASIIDRLIKDEHEAYLKLSKLYVSMTCNPLIIPFITPPSFTTYLEGIKLALRQEIVENRNVVPLYSSTTVLEIQKVFFTLLFKTYFHTTYLNYLLIINMCK